MTVSSEVNSVSYNGNGSTQIFAVPYYFLADSHLRVILRAADGTETVQAITTNYTVSGAGNQAGGQVTMLEAPATGVTLVILRNVPATQETDYVANDPFPAESHERALDKLTMLVQQGVFDSGRALRVPDSDPEPNRLAPAAQRANLLLGFDASGQPITVAPVSGSATDLAINLANSTDPSKGAALVGAYGRTVYDNLREKLSGNRTYYVRTDGNDSNDGRSNTAAGAFLTIQKAADVVHESLDLNGYSVTIQVANGTYTAGAIVSRPFVGGGSVFIVGNTASPASVVVNANAVGVFYAELGAAYDVRGFKITNSTGDGVYAQTGAFISVGQMEYGACAASQVTVGGSGNVLMTQPYTVSGGGSSHLHAGSQGRIWAGTFTVNISGTPAFSAYFAGAAQGAIIIPGLTFTGSATGARYLAHKGGVIETNPGLSPALPGSIAGRVAFGGAYIGSNSEPFDISVSPASAAAMNFNAFDGTTQTFRTILSCVTDPSGTGRGYLFVNGANSYLSNMTHLGTTAQVQASSGTADGVTVSQGGEINASRPSAPCAYWRRRSSDGQLHVFYRDTTQSGNISVSAGATTYNTTSDYRAKTKPVKISDAVERFKKLKPCTFEMLSAPGVKHEGFIAHEVAEVVPGAVTGEKDAMRAVGRIIHLETGDVVGENVERPDDLGEEYEWQQTGEEPAMQSLDVSKLVPLMTATIKELIARVEDLERK